MTECVLDLFSGIGGFSLGLERTGGFKTVAFCEVDPYCQQVLAKHWPNVPIYKDIRTLSYDQQPDLICGGFPCKQTSVAAAVHGKRNGLDGQDSGLWWHYQRIVQTLRPTWVIVENPAGVKKWSDQIKAGLESAGYGVSLLEHKASDVGLPHQRRRVFFVANAHGKRLEKSRTPRPSQIAWQERLTAAGGNWLQTTPGDGGSHDGVSRRLDRLRALGNAVVPQVVEMIGRAILTAKAPPDGLTPSWPG